LTAVSGRLGIGQTEGDGDRLRGLRAAKASEKGEWPRGT